MFLNQAEQLKIINGILQRTKELNSIKEELEVKNESSKLNHFEDDQKYAIRSSSLQIEKYETGLLMMSLQL